MRKIHLSLLLGLTLLLLASGRADARPVHFVGGHPIAAKYGGGYCLIDAPHMHVYSPDHQNLYQHVGDQFVFTADPTPFGYEGEKHPFYGHHPVATVEGEPVFCYLDGPHFHPFEVPDGPAYETRKGIAFYMGPFPPTYAKLRPARARVVNAEYRPYVALRPTIEVSPPEQWQGEVWVAPPSVAVNAPGVAVSAPGVVVNAPGVFVNPPSVTVNAPGVYVSPPRVAVRAPGVVFGGPSVAVSAPGVIVAAPGVAVSGGVYVEEREHHDNGKHKGWYKHGGRR